MSPGPSILRPSELVHEAKARALAASLNAGELEGVVYTANCVNESRGLWEVRYTEPDGFSDRWPI